MKTINDVYWWAVATIGGLKAEDKERYAYTIWTLERLLSYIMDGEEMENKEWN